MWHPYGTDKKLFFDFIDFKQVLTLFEEMIYGLKNQKQIGVNGKKSLF